MNNSITIVGHVGQSPKAISFPASSKKLVKFSVAVKEYSSNNEEPKTLWIDVEAWNGMGDRALATITKGREVVVQGRLAMTSYSKTEDGKTTNVTKPVIRLSGYHLCGKKPEASTEAQPNTEESSKKSKKSSAA